MENSDYRVTILQPLTATYDQHDGFGDFVNYKERTLGVVGAVSSTHAIALMEFMVPAEFKSTMQAVLVA